MDTQTSYDAVPEPLTVRPELAAKLRSLSVDDTTHEPTRRRRWPLTTGLIALVAGTAAYVSTTGLPDAKMLFASQPPTEASPVTPPPANITAPAPVAEAALPVPAATAQPILGSGYVQARRLAILTPARTGRIIEVRVAAGDKVVKGDALIEFDTAEATLARDMAAVALDLARTEARTAALNAEAASDEAARAASLFARNAIAEATEEAARHAYKQAQAEAAAAELAIERARLDLVQADRVLADHILRAPFDGIVAETAGQVGAVALAAGDGGPADAALVTLFDPASLVIEIDVAETSLPRLEPGLRGTAVLDAWPDDTFDVALDRVAPVANAERGVVRLTLTAETPPAGIRPNMAVRASLSPNTAYAFAADR